jgi:hypothetical protein
MSSQGALLGGLVGGVPTFLAMHSYLHSRNVRDEQKTLKAEIDGLKEQLATAKGPGTDEGTGAKEISVYAAQAPGGRISVRGIAIVRAVAIEHIQQEMAFHVQCVVDFVGLIEGQRASPLELVLTGRNGMPELATLKTKSAATQAGATIYEGRADARLMERHVCNCMTSPKRVISNMAFPVDPGFYWCDVEVHRPAGHALAEHERSGIKLDFELEGGSCHRAMVRVN